jgi:hypothetical protein
MDARHGPPGVPAAASLVGDPPLVSTARPKIQSGSSMADPLPLRLRVGRYEGRGQRRQRRACTYGRGSATAVRVQVSRRMKSTPPVQPPSRNARRPPAPASTARRPRRTLAFPRPFSTGSWIPWPRDGKPARVRLLHHLHGQQAPVVHPCIIVSTSLTCSSLACISISFESEPHCSVGYWDAYVGVEKGAYVSNWVWPLSGDLGIWGRLRDSFYLLWTAFQ